MPETTALLAERFDHIFYTGNGRVGAHRDGGGREAPDAGHARARRQEPVHRRRDADLDVAARRIAWGKFLNAGQTCIAPDYVLVHAATARPS